MNAVMTAKRLDARRAPVGPQVLRRSFVVNLEHGLHARPCAVLIKTLQPYRVTVQVEANGEKASGKSILGLMALGAGQGSQISFSLEGEDAFKAMAEIDRLFLSNFESVYRAVAVA